MRSMFAMGFAQDVFGSRLESPMLGRVGMRPYLGQNQVNGDSLLQQTQTAEAQVAAANQYIQNHPNLQQDLGSDFANFQAYMQTIANTTTSETNLSQQIAASGPGATINASDQDLQNTQQYIGAAGALAQIIANHPNVSPAVNTQTGAPIVNPPPAAPAGAPTATQAAAAGGGLLNALIPGQKAGTAPAAKAPTPAPSSGIPTPFLIGGGVLAVGLVALLAKG